MNFAVPRISETATFSRRFPMMADRNRLMKKNIHGFKFERKRIRRDKRLVPICKDYESGFAANCKKANYCKNATYSWDGRAMGTCYGGTKESEIEHRIKYPANSHV